MFLNRILIKNFRQFRDVEIDLPHSENKNITMILGNSGVGKTNFLNAISWCLYGTEIYDYASSLSICNIKSQNLTLLGDKIEVRVELEFFDEDILLIFNRVIGFIKREDGLIRESSLDKFELKIQDEQGIRITENFYHILESKFPKHLQDYFLFDLTRLNKFFNEFDHKSLKDTIFSFAQVNLLKEVNMHIQYVKQMYIQNQKKISPKLGKVNEKINDIENKLKDLMEQLDRAKKYLENVTKEIHGIDEELINRNSEDIYRGLKRSKKLDKRFTRIDKKLFDLENNLENHILLKYPYIMSYNSILKFLELSEEHIKKGYVPQNVRFFIQDLLDGGKCICGTDLDVDKDHRRVLEDFLKVTENAPNYAEDLPQILNHIKNVIIEDIKKFKSTSREYHREIMSLENERELIINEKREIEAMINLNSVDEIEILIKQRNDLIALKKHIELKIIGLKARIEEYKQLLGQQRKLLSHQDELFMEFNTYQKKIDLCDGVSIATNDIYDGLSNNLREKVKNRTKESLIRIHWMDGIFSDLNIDENFKIDIINNYGNIVNPLNLSYGEKSILAFCLICAFHSFSGFDLPIVMDNPFFNLDSEIRKNLINSLPEIIENNQVIFLSTEDDFFKDLAEYVGKEYRISLDSSEDGVESEVILNG